MKNYLLYLVLAFTLGSSLNTLGQQKPIDENLIEVGVVELLEDTIPMDLPFKNEDNETVTLGELITKPTVLSFVYFDCPGLCSPLLEGVSKVVEKSDLVLGEDYQVITISFNTSDTPEKARTKKVNFVQQISKEYRDDWIYLTGDQEEIDAITHAVGYKYKPQGLDWAHPSVIVVLSPSGKITRYLYGIDFLPFDFKMAVVEAQKGLARPTINKVLEYCFSYDPEGQGYTLQVTRVTGTIILFFALVLFGTLLFRRKKRNSADKTT